MFISINNYIKNKKIIINYKTKNLSIKIISYFFQIIYINIK